MKLKNKVALVTGGSRGIGRAISLGLADEGAMVVVNYHSNKKAADEVVRKIKTKGRQAISVQADVSKKKEIDRMVNIAVKKFGKIDILVNNAGIGPFVDFFDVTEEIWDRIQAINTKSIFFASQAVARVMVDRKIRGKIINITSISGEKATDPLQVPYCTSKGGANMLTKIMAVALAQYKINVNAILPGTVETDINRDILANKKVREGIINNTPLRILGEPTDIVEATILFASEGAKWITGSLLVIDGGFTA